MRTELNIAIGRASIALALLALIASILDPAIPSDPASPYMVAAALGLKVAARRGVTCSHPARDAGRPMPAPTTEVPRGARRAWTRWRRPDFTSHSPPPIAGRSA